MPITLVIPMGCLGLTVEHSQEPVGIYSWSLNSRSLEAEHCWAWIGGRMTGVICMLAGRTAIGLL
uniref:Uncharacterized protein n=1 Tax=Picea sitchensis TaxID=3332 RepID=A0A6B9XSC9_PICSI|nr:hypothetical protein Q903MT_gene3905 [Picea sitchensis]